MPRIDSGLRVRAHLAAAGIALLALAASATWTDSAETSSLHASPSASPGAPDPAARMLDGAAAGEYWDIRARLEGGAYFFARFWVTNEGPASHTAIAMGSFVGADGARADFRYGRERAAWTLAGDGRYLEIASAVLDLRAPTGRVELDTNRQGIKIYLRFPIGDTPQSPCAHRDDHGGFDVLALAAPIDGIAWTKAMPAPLAAKGTIDVTHGWSTQSEIEYVHRRIEVTARNDDIAVYGSELVAPTGERRTCVAVTRGTTLLYDTRLATVEAADQGLRGATTGYPIPTRLRFNDEQLELVVTPARVLLSINPLDVVPQPFRFLLGLRSRPRRTWTDGTWHLRLAGGDGRAPLDVRGDATTTVSYTNPSSDAPK